MANILCREEWNEYFIKNLLAHAGARIFYNQINVMIAKSCLNRDSILFSFTYCVPSLIRTIRKKQEFQVFSLTLHSLIRSDS